MDAAHESLRHLPVLEFRVFLEEDGQRILIAQYYASDLPPEVDSILDIADFKERPEYPDRVKVLQVTEAGAHPVALILAERI